MSQISWKLPLTTTNNSLAWDDDEAPSAAVPSALFLLHLNSGFGAHHKLIYGNLIKQPGAG